MVLSDRDIKAELASGRIVIQPLDPKDVQPASVDVRLGSSFRIFRNSTHTYIDPTVSQPELTEAVEVPEGGQFVLHPGQFVLGTTLERIAVPDDILGKLEGKSTLGRLGLMITRRPATLTRAGTARLRSSSPTWRRCPSSCTRACASARCRSSA